MENRNVPQLTLTPLGPGDVIDRAVRLYRQHFVTLLRIAAPPTLLTAISSVLLTIGWQSVRTTGSSASLAFYASVLGGGALLWLLGMMLNIVVMGGASRNLVTHLLRGEAVSVRTTYRNVWARFGGLLGAAGVMLLWFLLAWAVAATVFYVGLVIVVIAAFAIFQVHYYLAIIAALVVGLVFGLLAMGLFFFLAGQVAYVPQAMLIEGKRLGAAVSRSMALARNNMRRLMALVLFSSCATYSALMLLLLPLGWYGYLQGVNPSPWQADSWPVWYSVGYTVLSQSSVILLAPVWMLGLSLMYIDERVRHEGYDIELLAARQLDAMPELPPDVALWYNPAVAATPQAQSLPRPVSGGSVLGLH